MAKYGQKKSVELDALEPKTLRRLIKAAIKKYWDKDANKRRLEDQKEEREVAKERIMDYLGEVAA